MRKSQSPPNPLESFTIVGRLLVIATIIVGGAGFVWYTLYIHENLPAGRYPIAFILIPVVMILMIFFGVSAAILGWLGVAIHNSARPDESNTEWDRKEEK